MKNFLKVIPAVMIFASFGSIMATAPTSNKVEFSKISFEPGEISSWSLDNDNGATSEIITTNVVDEINALKINIPNRADTWPLTSHYIIRPPKGKLWTIDKSSFLTASITNPNPFDIQLRVNINDSLDNARMNYFIVNANQTREISITSEQFGNPGIVTEIGGNDGYKQNGVDSNAIELISFYLPEPDEDYMKGQTSFSYIIDNIQVQNAQDYAVIDGPCLISNVNPSTKPEFAGMLKLPGSLLSGTNLIAQSNGKAPGNMNVAFTTPDGNLFSDSTSLIKAVKPGDKIIMKLQMYDSYAIKNGSGESILEVELSSNKNIDILTPTQSWTFIDDKKIGVKGKSLNFEFIMPNGTVDALLDFDWKFSLK